MEILSNRKTAMEILSDRKPTVSFTNQLQRKLDRLVKSKKHMTMLSSEEFGELHSKTSGNDMWSGWITYHNRQITFSCNQNGQCVMWK